MPEKVVKDKVLCYVVREGRLLVFRHTDYSYEEVGIQVPAGSIQPGETPEEAALREAREETGLKDFTIVRLDHGWSCDEIGGTFVLTEAEADGAVLELSLFVVTDLLRNPGISDPTARVMRAWERAFTRPEP